MPEWVPIAWQIAQTVVLAAIGIHQWIIASDRVRREALDTVARTLGERIAKLEQTVDHRVDVHGDRLAKLEAHCATSEQLHQSEGKAHGRMDLISDGLNDLKGSMRRIEVTLDMVHQYLLTQPRKTA
jgi:hypothetical protein